MTINEYFITAGWGCSLDEMKVSDYLKIINKINETFHTKYSWCENIKIEYLNEVLGGKIDE